MDGGKAMIITRAYIEKKVQNAIKKNYSHARIRKTGDNSVDAAIMETIVAWGYKVAQNNSYIVVML
nr:MAG TPA_asm: hypothetical protein [Caudoviricetes sp.]